MNFQNTKKTRKKSLFLPYGRVAPFFVWGFASVLSSETVKVEMINEDKKVF